MDAGLRASLIASLPRLVHGRLPPSPHHSISIQRFFASELFGREERHAESASSDARRPPSAARGAQEGWASRQTCGVWEWYGVDEVEAEGGGEREEADTPRAAEHTAGGHGVAGSGAGEEAEPPGAWSGRRYRSNSVARRSTFQSRISAATDVGDNNGHADPPLRGELGARAGSSSYGRETSTERGNLWGGNSSLERGRAWVTDPSQATGGGAREIIDTDPGGEIRDAAEEDPSRGGRGGSTAPVETTAGPAEEAPISAPTQPGRGPPREG